jgi:polyhydroxybutyrate depolymerase
MMRPMLGLSRSLFAQLSLLLLVSACGTAAPSGSGAPRAGVTFAPTALASTAVPTATSACLGVVGGTSQTVQVSVDTQQRQVLVHVPPSGSAQLGGVPVVVMFHGYGDTSKLAEDMTGLSSRADTADFIAVYPQAAGERPKWDIAGASDTHFVDTVLTRLAADPCVDPARIYSVGISMGGAMANVVACRMADRIAALATVSGLYGPNWGDPCQPVRSVPVIAFHGLIDPIVPYGGGPIVDPDTGVNPDLPPVIGAEAWAGGWATHDGCISDAQPQAKIGKVQPLFWAGCVAPVEFFRVTDGGHTWPGSSWDEALTNRDVSATDLIWAFFKSSSLPGH